MRDSIVNCFKNTIIFKYNLPNDELAIDKSIYTTDLDYCYESADDSKLEEIIYNSIIDYAFNDEEFENENLDELHIEALSQRVRIEDTDSDETKERYGIYGEVLLNLILRIYYETDMIISKGYFYDILKPEENKGYDSFHLIERSTETSLWFGEVKFYQNYKSALNSIFSNIEKAISNDYFRRNLLAITPKRKDLNTKSKTIKEIIEKLRKKPSINIIELKKEYNLKLVYPVLVVCQAGADYDSTIKNIIECINTNYSGKNLLIGVDYNLFFILMPVGDVKSIKQNVIKWINSKKPLTLL